MLQGPDLTSTLIGVLMRFRKEQVTLIADIEGMFHQVKVVECDRDFLHYIWLQDDNYNHDLQSLRGNPSRFPRIGH